MIYFIKSPNGPIKIGTTIRLSERLKRLTAEHGEGLQLLAVIDGGHDAEKALHRRFKHLRAVKEWFQPGDDLLGFIASDGRPWDGGDEDCGPNDVTIRIDKGVASMAKAIARQGGTTVSEVIGGAAIGNINRLYAKMLRQLEAEGEYR